MPGQDEARRFDFVSQPLPQETFSVVSFTGTEALSELFTFDIVLASPDAGVDLETVIGAPAVLTLHGQGGAFDYRGIVSAFAMTGKTDELAFYRATLMPRAILASLDENNRLFLDKTPQACIEEAFQDAGLTPGVDFEFRLTGASESWPSITQFRESSFAFASRWMERDGLYYFFEQTPNGAKMVIVDDKSAHQPLPGRDALRYEPPSGLVAPREEAAVHDFRRRLSPMPRSVLLKDWNYETPSLDLRAEAPVLPDGRGSMRFYGDHFPTVAAGRRLAQVRAEELLCRHDTVEGRTSFPAMTAGRLMRLTHHWSEPCNQEYLVTSVSHEGRQFTPLTAGLAPGGDAAGESETFYRNTFAAQPASVQFRAPRNTPWPRHEGVVNAVIDGPGSGKYASVDDQGRYKVILAYDRSGRRDGKASKWIRMAQPYGGSRFGLHFPLHKGCEATLAFLDGDPDRPVILGAAPNPDNKSVVTNASQTRCDLQTAGGNQLYFEDKEGSQRILMQSKANRTFLRMGAPNDPSSWYTKASAEGQSGITFNTPDAIDILAGSSLSTYMIWFMLTILGGLEELYLISQIGINVGFSQVISGHTFKIINKDGEIGFMAKWVHGSKEQIEESRKELVGELIDTAEEVDTLDEEIEELVFQIQELSTEVNEMAQSVTELADTEDVINGELNALVQENTSLAQKNTKLAGEVQEMTDSNIKLFETVTKTADEAHTMVTDAMELATERTLMFDTITTSAENFNTLGTLQIIL